MNPGGLTLSRDAVLIAKLSDLLHHEFDGFDISLYPNDTYGQITKGFLKQYWTAGWHKAWAWASCEVAKIIREGL